MPLFNWTLVFLAFRMRRVIYPLWTSCPRSIRCSRCPRLSASCFAAFLFDGIYKVDIFLWRLSNSWAHDYSLEYRDMPSDGLGWCSLSDVLRQLDHLEL